MGRPPDLDSTVEMEEGLAPGALSRLLEQLAAVPSVPAGEPVPPGPGVGEVVGRFRLDAEIGRGGFGRVYRATDLELGREVALKLVKAGRKGKITTAEWMRAEAEAAAQLRHRNVVTLYDAGHWEGSAYLVYELLRGQTLADRLVSRRLPRREARQVLSDLARALAHAHAAGVVHRDVKPANVFLEEDGGVKLLDLGLAQLAGAIGIAAGTPPWMAPEQGRGTPADTRSDVYAWGMLAALLVDGELPAQRPGRIRLRTPGSLAALAEMARSEDPALRPRDGAALLAALGRIEVRRRRWRIGGIVATALAVVGTAVAPLLLRPPTASLPPVRVAVADPAGAADAVEPGLSAEVGRRLAALGIVTVVERARIDGVLRASGHAPGPRLDPEMAAFAARQVGAAAVIVAGAHREGDEVLLSLEARASDTGAILASASGRASIASGEIGEAVDRLVRSVAGELDRYRRAPGASERALDRAVTASLEAQRRYASGLRCKAEPSRGESWIRTKCADHFRAALAFDPEFALAHFELARDAVFAGTPREQLLVAIGPALERIDRVPARERAQLLAWKADLDGRSEEGISILRRARAEYPDDARLAFALAQALERRGRLAESVAPLERALELDPGFEAATDALTWALGLLDRPAELKRLAERMASLPPYPGTIHAEVQARGWAGDVEGALRVARRGAGAGRAAQEDLVEALAAAGRIDEALGLVGAEAKQGGAGARRLGALLYLAGRRREAGALLDPPLPPDAPDLDRWIAGVRRVWRQAERREGAAIARFARETAGWSRTKAASLAPVLAYCGEVELALELAPDMDGQPGTRRLLDAIVTWRREGAAAALPELRAMAGGEGVFITAVLPPEAPAWLAAECAAEAEPGGAALADVRRFQRIYRPLGPWRAWAHPRSLLLEARLLAGLGRREEARAALDRLDALWSRADRGLPLLAEARALRRRIDAGGSKP